MVIIWYWEGLGAWNPCLKLVLIVILLQSTPPPHTCTHSHTHPLILTMLIHTYVQLLAGGNSGRLPTKLTTPSNPSPSHPPPPTTPSSSTVGGWPGKKRVRSFDFDDNPKRRRTTPYSARQSGDKQHNKGLRHFSQRVCEKVREKGTTTYNEVSH